MREAVDIGLGISVNLAARVELGGLDAGGAWSAPIIPRFLTGGRASDEYEVTL